MADSGFHNDYVNAVLDGFLNAGSGVTLGADPWICLFDLATGWDADINCSTDEVSGGTGPYARQQAAFSAAAAGTSDNDANIDFTGMPACTVYAVGICASTTEGTDDCIIGGDLTASKACNSGDTFRIAAGDLDVSITGTTV